MYTPTNEQSEEFMGQLAEELGVTVDEVREMSGAEVQAGMERLKARYQWSAHDAAREVLIASRIIKLMTLAGCPDDMTIQDALDTGRVSPLECERAMNPTEEQITRELERPKPAE